MLTPFFLLLICSIQAPLHAFPFRDRSVFAGLDYSIGARNKYGGAAVADLDADGWPDLIFGHHSNRTELYFNNRNGTFTKSRWRFLQDVHAINPFRFNAKTRRMFFSISVGGGRGRNPVSPEIFKVTPSRAIFVYTSRAGVSRTIGRGRSAIFMRMVPNNTFFNDVIITNAKSKTGDLNHQKAMRGFSLNRFQEEPLVGFARNINHWGSVTDIDNDGQMEFMSYHSFSIFRLVAPFQLSDISSTVLPPRLDFRATIAVAELDFDNDGDFDLYIARTTTPPSAWLRGINTDDYLLRNDGGRFVDVSASSGIARRGESRGVTVGDFNNDGWIDIVVTRYNEGDVIMFNNGDGTFRSRDPGFGRARTTRGDGVTAVDYDRDGRLDLIISEGSWTLSEFQGFYRILRNVAPIQNFLLVRVGSSTPLTASSMHAVVRVQAGSLRMMRRVGSPGASTSVSYIELMHFGLGSFTSASVTVTWTDGHEETRTGVRARATITMGRYLV